MILGYDHVQVAIPAASEAQARAFYGDLLGMVEMPKPGALAGRGGCWFMAQRPMTPGPTVGAPRPAATDTVLHLGVETPFRPARKAHPAFIVDDLDLLSARLVAAGYDCVHADGEIAGVRRFHTFDPFGNRLEFQQA